MVAYHSVPVMSPCTSPPLGPSVLGSAYERSGDILSQDEPSLVERQTFCDATYSVRGSCGESSTGNVH